MIELETRKYLDEEWRTHRGERSGKVYVEGSDGDSIFTCDSYSAAHFLTPETVAEYLIEQHGAAKRLAARERDIERAVASLRNALLLPMEDRAAEIISQVRRLLQPKSEAPSE
jgi:hypothetical protein